MCICVLYYYNVLQASSINEFCECWYNYDKIANAFTGASMTYDPCQFLHVHTLSFILYAPSIHACRDVTVLRLVGGGTVEEDILQCAQSKLQLEHDLISLH